MDDVAQDFEVDDLDTAHPPHWDREHFIPLRKAELIRILADDDRLSNGDREHFTQLCRLLEATFHYEYHEALEELKDLYSAFNPDSITKESSDPSPEELDRRAELLFERLTTLLERANYERLNRAEIELAVGAASDWGVRLHIDFGIFDRLEVFSRGDVTSRRRRRRWQNLYRQEVVDVPVYQRLVVVFRLRDHKLLDSNDDTSALYLKIFKHVPKQDIDMLLPGARFRMSLLDRSKAIFPTASGIAITGFKLFKGAVLLSFATVASTLAFLGLVGGTIGYGLKSFLGYLRTKDKYQLSLTRSLYYQNLDNNAGVLFRLLDEAEEQEFREAVLAYALLRRRAGPDGWDMETLDREAEAYLSQLLDFSVDFEVHDALDKLERLGCAHKGANGRWTAVPLMEALANLDKAWDGYFQHHDPFQSPS